MVVKVPESVCLVIPPSIFLLDERVFMSLGILRVAAVLENAGVKVEMLDLSGISNFVEVAVEHAANSKSNIFGFTATTPQIPAVAEIVTALSKTNPNIKTIIGGPHVTLVNAAYKKELASGIEGRAVRSMNDLFEMFDVLLAGDGGTKRARLWGRLQGHIRSLS